MKIKIIPEYYKKIKVKTFFRITLLAYNLTILKRFKEE